MNTNKLFLLAIISLNFVAYSSDATEFNASLLIAEAREAREARAALQLEVDRLTTELAALRAVPLAVAPTPPFYVYQKIDTITLLESINTNNITPYFKDVRVNAIARSDAFINALLPTNDMFLASTISVGGPGQPFDHTRDSFKAAVREILQAVVPDYRATPPASAKHDDLGKTIRNISLIFYDAIDIWLYKLSPSPSDQFLHPSVPHSFGLDSTRRSVEDFFASYIIK